MKQLNTIGSVLLAAALLIGPAFAQRKESLGENAALRYWAAFSQLQDAAITDQQAKELNSALENLGAHDLSKYADLVQKNAPALEIMARGTSLSRCDWGLDYGLGENTPVDYARRALALGRLNVLYAIQLYHSGDPEHAIHALVAGLRFSRDVGNGGSFFATLVAKDLLVTHLMAVDAALRIGQLSAAQRSEIQAALAGLGNGLDWAAAAKLDLDALRAHFGGDGQNSAALGRIRTSYIAALNDSSKLPALNDAIANAPEEVAGVIPNAKRVVEQKQELIERLARTRALLR